MRLATKAEQASGATPRGMTAVRMKWLIGGKSARHSLAVQLNLRLFLYLATLLAWNKYGSVAIARGKPMGRNWQC